MFESFKKKVDPEIQKIEDEAKEKVYKKVKNEAYKNHVERVLKERAETDAKNMAEKRWGNKPMFQGITKLLPKMSEEDKKAGQGILRNFADFYGNLSNEELIVVAKKKTPIKEDEDAFDVQLVKNMKRQNINDMEDLL